LLWLRFETAWDGIWAAGFEQRFGQQLRMRFAKCFLFIDTLSFERGTDRQEERPLTQPAAV